MSASAPRSRDSKCIAVIRIYEPTRIERELLAQVFDLAERGLPPRSACLEGQLVPVEQIADLSVDTLTQNGLVDQGIHREGNELETVA